MDSVVRIVLIGFSGTGKSTVARLLADTLGWGLVDTDADIEREHGLTIPEIFAKFGEPFFRAAERCSLLAGLDRSKTVIATGGGAVVDPVLWDDRHLRKPETLVIALEATPETVLCRLQEHHAREGSGVERPMITGADPLAKIARLKASRQAVYDQADVTLIVEKSDPKSVADEILALLQAEKRQEVPAITLNAASASSKILIAPGSIESIGMIAKETWTNARKAWVITDETVGAIHGDRATAALSKSGFIVSLRTVPVGESSKSWATAGSLLDWLLDEGIERGDIVIALGGGVIGDLAGFVGAIVLRGVPVIQIPTSLLAMVDSSIGGKTGLNHRTGKNLIGAFSQPPVVVIDPDLLRTLPHRELTAGWAEIVKHAIIQQSTPGGDRADLLPFLERNVTSLKALKQPVTTYAIWRNVALKAAVVEADEKETGIRAYLNFGHTLGHAIEASDYRLIHGEAVAVGMRGAIQLAANLGLVGNDFVERINALLYRFELPVSAEIDESLVMSKMTSDKKRVAGTQRWVLPVAGGGIRIHSEIPEIEVQRALAQVTVTR